MTTPSHRFETKLIHAGEPRPPVRGAVVTPIFQSATFEVGEHEDYHQIAYIRLNNTPNHLQLHAKLAALENAEAAVVTASGMAAISTTLFALLKTGDHVLAQECLYGGTSGLLVKDLPKLGIGHTLIDPVAPDTWKENLRPTTRVVYVETISNPLLGVGDLKAVAAFARANGLISVIDNTFASPVNFRPIDHGFDLVVHSATKYLNGHSDLVAGVVLGRANLVRTVKHTLNHLGGSLDPHACFLLSRGLKTLAVRVKHQNESSLAIARWLQTHPAVARVNHPGLESHPTHRFARELLAGTGGMVSFELKGGVAAADRLLAAVTLPMVAPSLGGVESLITRPSTTSHSGVAAEDRRRQGISDGLIRLSVGLEATDDLIADLAGGLGPM